MSRFASSAMSIKTLGLCAASIVALFAGGCEQVSAWLETEEYADARTARDLYLQAQLSEVQVVAIALGDAIRDQEARLHAREVQVESAGRSVEQDGAYQRWSAVLADMRADQSALLAAADEAYLKHNELELSGSSEPSQVEELDALKSSAIAIAVDVQARLDAYARRIAGTESADEGEPTYGDGVDPSWDGGDDDGSGVIDLGEIDVEALRRADGLSSDEEESVVSLPRVRRASSAIARTWRDDAGTLEVAAYLDSATVEEGQATIYVRELSGGELVAIEFDRLCQEDRDFARELVNLDDVYDP